MEAGGSGGSHRRLWRQWWRGCFAKNAMEKKANGDGGEVGQRKVARKVFMREGSCGISITTKSRLF